MAQSTAPIPKVTHGLYMYDHNRHSMHWHAFKYSDLTEHEQYLENKRLHPDFYVNIKLVNDHSPDGF